MPIDYVQIHLSDIAAMLLDGTEADSGLRIRAACVDLVTRNTASVFPAVREALDNAEAWQSAIRAKMVTARAAKKDRSAGKEEEAKAEVGSHVIKDKVFDESLKDDFELFRKAYPGTKRGPKEEWDNFVKKNPAVDAVPLLMPALVKEKKDKAARAETGAFCPEWANMSTWINQRRWTQELNSPDPKASNPRPRYESESAKAARVNGEYMRRLEAGESREEIKKDFEKRTSEGKL